MITVKQQILAAIKFGVSRNKVIWQLLNLASPVYAVGDRRHLRMFTLYCHPPQLRPATPGLWDTLNCMQSLPNL